MTAAADLIRATVHNRVGNQVRGASLANHRHRRPDRSRAVLPAVACRAANSHFGPATPPSRRGLGGAHAGEPESGDLFTACGRRRAFSRSVVSPRASSVIRSLVYGAPLVYRNPMSLAVGPDHARRRRRGIVSADLQEDPIFHADEPASRRDKRQPRGRPSAHGRRIATNVPLQHNTGLMSTTGVPSMASMGPTRRRFPSISRTVDGMKAKRIGPVW